MVKRSNRVVKETVEWALDDAVFDATDWVFGIDLSEVTFRAVHRPVHDAAHGSVAQATNDAAHPALQDFLREASSGMRT
jgi:hypothetical protein